MKTIVFVYPKWILGGAELLFIRLGKIYKNEGFRVRIVYRNAEDEIKQRFVDNKFDEYRVNEWWSQKELEKSVDIEGDIYVITCCSNDFIRYKIIPNIKVMIYLLQNQILKIKEDDEGAEKNFSLTKAFINDRIKEGSIICMQPSVRDFLRDYFALDSRTTELIPIVRVGIDISNFLQNKLKKKVKEKHSLKILTVARADFPMKGYMIGLAKYLEQLDVDYIVRADFISYGRDQDILENLVAGLKLPDNISIVLHGKKDHVDLAPYFQECNLFIGMGTTVLEAAQYGTISIPVKAYTNELKASSYFHDDYDNFSSETDDNNVDYLIRHIMEMDANEYLEAGKKSRNIIEKYYDMNSNAAKILDCFEKMAAVEVSTAKELYNFRTQMHEYKNKKKQL